MIDKIRVFYYNYYVYIIISKAYKNKEDEP